ncbi:WD40-repeat-containing domain protein [Aspergillus crustosus]
MGLGDQFQKLIIQPLREIQGGAVTNAFIIIDGIDECERSEDAPVILELLQSAEPIIQGFKKIKDQDGDYQEVDLDRNAGSTIEHDITLFYEHRLPEIQRKRGLHSNWPGDENRKTLIAMSVPLFLFAATVCRLFEDCQWDPNDSLNEVLAYQFDHSEFDRTYRPILDQLLKNQSTTKTKGLIEEYRMVIGTMITVKEHLSASSLSRLIDMPFNIVKIRLNSLHSVLLVPEDDEQRFEKDMQLLPRKSDNPPDALGYACCYWAQHLARSNDLKSAFDEVVPFLEKHFLHWLEAMCCLGLVSEALEAMHTSQGTAQSEHPDASAFLEDARRFILRNRDIAETHPSQLYSSALIFAPRRSRVRQPFSDTLLNWTILPRGAESWDGRLLATGSEDATIRIWDATVWDLRHTLKGFADEIVSMVFSHDSSQLASGLGDGTIRIWDPVEGKSLQTFGVLDDHTVHTVAFSPDGRSLASGSDDKSIKLWNLSSGQVERELKGHLNGVISLSFSPDGCKLASASVQDSIRIWNLADDETPQILDCSTQKAVFSPNAQLLAFVATDGALRICDWTGNLQWHSGFILETVSLAFSSDSCLLASASLDNPLIIWDTKMGKLLMVLKDHSDDVQAIAFSNDGCLLASADEDGYINIWDLSSHMLQHDLGSNGYRDHHKESVLSIAFAPDGKLVASGSADSTIKLWDPIEGDVRRTLPGHCASVLSVSFSPVGQLLASGSSDKRIRIWSLDTDQEPQVLSGHSESVRCVAFSPTGHLLASGSDDNTIRLWNPSTGALMRVIKRAGFEGILSLVFSPNGCRLASGDGLGDIKIWQVKRSQRSQL